MSLVILGVVVIFICFVSIYSFEGKMDMDAIGLESTKASALIYGVFSAFGTVGVTAGITSTLHDGSKIILIALMFFGRLGPITLFQLFQADMSGEENIHFKRVQSDVIIG